MRTDIETIWVVDDDKSIRWVLEKTLSRESLTVESFESADDCIRALRNRQPGAIISDIRMPGTDGLSLLKQINEKHPGIPVIIMTAHSDLQSAVDSYEGGAFEYLPKPFDIEEVISVSRRALEHGRRRLATDTSTTNPTGHTIIGAAPAMQEVFRAIGRLAKSGVTVLINGQSGTGKELVAQALHTHSPRHHQPFVALNMAAIPADLIESELFGHEKGAFTGASVRRQGRFEQADGGTLFLDEIGDMPADAQTRLLRVLAEGEFYRVGGHSAVKVDIRIIAATHQNLEQLVLDGRFREDLFHRLNVIRLQLPTLAERADDIPELASHFLKSSATELQMPVKVLRPETLAHLQHLHWPGNVRQLENLCRWLTVMAPGHEVYPDDLPADMIDQQQRTDTEGNGDHSDWAVMLRTWAEQALLEGQPQILKQAVPLFETALIGAALEQTKGRKQDAAELLGWGRNTLTRKIKELGLGRANQRP